MLIIIYISIINKEYYRKYKQEKKKRSRNNCRLNIWYVKWVNFVR